MIFRGLVLSVAVLAAWVALQAGPAGRAGAPTSATAPAGSQPVSPAALAILKRLEDAGPKYPNLVADTDYIEVLVEQGDVQQYKGKVYYQAGAKDQPGRFRIHFDTVRQGLGVSAATLEQVEDYVFDGRLLIIAKERIKQQITYQLAPPGENIDALQLGKGPFPVPFGQKVETVLKFYNVQTRPPAPDDPPGTEYLRLTVRPEKRGEVQAVLLEMWVQREEVPAVGSDGTKSQAQPGLPVKIVARDASDNIKTVVFKNIVTPREHKPDTFTLPKRGGDWHVRVEPYPKEGARK